MTRSSRPRAPTCTHWRSPRGTRHHSKVASRYGLDSSSMTGGRLVPDRGSGSRRHTAKTLGTSARGARSASLDVGGRGGSLNHAQRDPAGNLCRPADRIPCDWPAKYATRLTPETPFYNTRAMDSLSAFKKSQITIHELGHTLGLGHPDTTYSQRASVMRGDPTSAGCPTSPTSWDRTASGVRYQNCNYE